MPQNGKKINSNPSPGLLQRMFGSSPMTPEIEEGIRIAQSENPELASVKPYGPISRILMPGAMGYTSPGRSIYLNPSALQGQSPQDVADTLMHEQKHVEQMKGRGFGPTREFLNQMLGGNEPYHRRPDELEAYQTEVARRAKMGRIQTAIPSFETGEFIAPQDIRLPPSKSKKINTGPTSNKLRNIAGVK